MPEGTGDEEARVHAEKRLLKGPTVVGIAERLNRVGKWSVELPQFRLTVSDEALAIHGIAPGGLLTVEGSINQYAPEHRETVNQAFSDCVRHGTRFDLEVQLTVAGGRFVWVRLIGEAVRDAAGAIRRVEGAIQDISERKQAVAETLRLTERLTTTLESITDAFFTLDRDWRFTFLNGAAERLLRRHGKELIGQDWRIEFPAAIDSAFGREYRRAIAENRTVEFEEFYPPLNTWFSVRAYPSREGLTVYFLDITERKRTEKALRESDAEFRTLAEGMPQIVWIANPEGGVVYVNRRWIEYTGLSVEESFGDRWNEAFHPEDRQRALAAWRHATATLGTYAIECRLRRRDGVYRWWLVRGVPMEDATVSPFRWFGTGTDIHDLKMAEEEISRANTVLTEHDEKFRQLANNVSDVFWVITPDLSKVEYVSPAYERVWGRSVESLYEDSHEWRDAILPQDRERNFSAFEGLGSENSAIGIEYRILRPDATMRWISHRAFAVRNEAGHLINITGIASDITERKDLEQATERALTRLNDAQRIGKIGDWDYEVLTRKITWSPQVFRIFGRDPALGPPRHLGESALLYDAPSGALMQERVALAIESGVAQQYQLVALRPDGEKVYVQVTASPRAGESGRTLSLHGTVQDISARIRDEQAIRDRARQQELVATLGHSALSNAEFDDLLVAAASAIARGLDVQFSKVVEFSAADGSFILRAGVGWEPGWLGRRISTMEDNNRLASVLASDQPVITDDFASQPHTGTPDILLAHGIASGVSLAIVCSDGPWGLLAAYSREKRRFSPESLDFLRSIANILAMAVDRNRRDAQLIRLSSYDALTVLPNRALLNDRLAVAVARAQRTGRRLALLYLDLDQFKNINDSFGHGAGDLLLQEVSRRLAAAIRESDTLGRQGGDEFLVLLPEIAGDDDAARVAGTLSRTMEEPVIIGGVELLVTTSIGIACFPENGSNPETLLRNADAAMYAAKKGGRGGYRFYSDEMNARAHGRLLLESDLSRAISRNELFLQFQPQITMVSGAIAGVEALVRWRHPTLGIVPPSRFISVAEESGLIIAIGGWVLETACRQQAQWTRDHIACGRMSVNVSALQFRQPGFVETVRETIRRAGLEPPNLEIELTESVVMDGADIVSQRLIDLNKLGVQFAIDDFGTGQSNLSSLKRFPLRRLKIDQSFVAGLPGDRENAALSQAVVSMGHALGLNVIAEGVETKEQAGFMQAIGCDEAQGFFYSRPLLAEDCSEFLRNERIEKHFPVPEWV